MCEFLGGRAPSELSGLTDEDWIFVSAALEERAKRQEQERSKNR